MGRANKQKASGNKNSLPQTPKDLKIEANHVDEEFASELGEKEKLNVPKPK
ncbi:YfhD family protein [Niallia nealsonii]|uniref:YfhD family protein n=1 Tax=Niallia nealsonii TaxID=115979 RepID=UPI0012FF2562|nr:YfhD family protein [Niallia nealsonii]